MLTSRLMLAAEGVVRDVETNGISVYNILEEIQPAGYPILIQRCFVLAFVERLPEDPERNECSVRLTLDNIELVTVPIVVAFERGFRQRSIIHVGGLVLPHSGQLTFSLIHGDRTLNTYRVLVAAAPVTVEPH